jgi:hypothetical protein
MSIRSTGFYSPSALPTDVISFTLENINLTGQTFSIFNNVSISFTVEDINLGAPTFSVGTGVVFEVGNISLTGNQFTIGGDPIYPNAGFFLF